MTPTVPGGDGFDWILPTDATGDVADGAHQQQRVRPVPVGARPARGGLDRTVAEATSTDYTPGRPGLPTTTAASCATRHGDVRVVEDDFVDPAEPSVRARPDRAGDRHLHDLQLLRLRPGDRPGQGELARPRSAVTSIRRRRSPRSTPSRTPATRPLPTSPSPTTAAARSTRPRGRINVGDTNSDDLLDPGETWHFTCTQPVPVAVDRRPVNFVNTADVTGPTPPAARSSPTPPPTTSTCSRRPSRSTRRSTDADEADDHRSGTVTYTYVVTNAGNTPLRSVDLADDTPPCSRPRR